MTKEALKSAIEFAEYCLEELDLSHMASNQAKRLVQKSKEALAKPEQEPVAWKLLPREATREMLRAMDECSTEGYDERLYAGHAASVYMAAVDAAPTPPQRTWVGLTPDEIRGISLASGESLFSAIMFTHDKLKEKNT